MRVSARCEPSPPGGGQEVALPGSPGVEVPTQYLTSGELGMLMKSIEAFVPNFPKLELGDASTRAKRLTNWRVTPKPLILQDQSSSSGGTGAYRRQKRRTKCLSKLPCTRGRA